MAEALCGKWMPRRQTYCVRGEGHGGSCGSPESMVRQRERTRAKRVYDPVAVARWKLAHRFARYSLTQEKFGQLLERQGGACAMCRRPFAEGQAICVDHDHACCPGEKKSCGRCIRGLLCLRCNTGLGYVERMSDMARAYLERVSGLPLVW